MILTTKKASVAKTARNNLYIGVFELSCLTMIITDVLSLEIGIDRGSISCSKNHESVRLSVEKGDYGYLTSLDYPDNYTVNYYHGHSCHVEIRGCSTCKLKVTLEEVNFPDCPAQQKSRHRNLCIPGCDHLQIHEVDQPYNTKSRRNYHSDNEGLVFQSISSNIRVRHCMSNGTAMLGKKFRIKYEVIEKRQEIRGTVLTSLFNGDRGEITSPNFPDGYALNGETFTYIIRNMDPYGHIRVVFDDWDVATVSTLQVFDGLGTTAPARVFNKKHRPVIFSESSTLIFVFNTGKSKQRCCHPVGFRASFQFVSEQTWDTQPNTNCSLLIDSESGGKISLDEIVSQRPGIFDCVWIIKRPTKRNPDGILLRLMEVVLGEGWLKFDNSIEVIAGVTSRGTLLGRYNSANLTLTQWISSNEGLYIRLRGALSADDQFVFIFSAVDNVTDSGCPKEKDFMCHNLWCIDRMLTCDGVDHCGDNSDESTDLMCSVSDIWKLGIKWKFPFQESSTQDPCAGNFKCGGNKHDCLPLSRVCDGIKDCYDHSDEIYCAYYSKRSSTSNTSSILSKNTHHWLPILIIFICLFVT